MRKIGLLLIAGVLALTGCGSDSLNSYTEAFGYEKALAVAKKENKRLFVDFSATWCPPCQELKKGLHDPRVVAALKNYVVLLIDVDRDPKLPRQFGVQGIPAYFVVDANGTKLQSNTGYEGVEELLEWLKQADRKQ